MIAGLIEQSPLGRMAEPDRVTIKSLVNVQRYVAEVRRREHIVERPVGMIHRQRLDVEDVYGGAGNSMFSQGSGQGALVDDRAARHSPASGAIDTRPRDVQGAAKLCANLGHVVEDTI